MGVGGWGSGESKYCNITNRWGKKSGRTGRGGGDGGVGGSLGKKGGYLGVGVS